MDKNDFHIPSPDEVFKVNETANDRQVSWFVEKIILCINNAVKNGAGKYQQIRFSMPREPVNQKTKLEVSKMFAEEGWEIIWEPAPMIRAMVYKVGT